MNLTQDALLGYLAYKLLNAQVKSFPFPHLYVENIFPEDFYTELLDNLPPDGDYSSGKSSYHGRRFASSVPETLLSALRLPQFTEIASYAFKPWIAKRFGGTMKPYTDLRLIRDQENYSIGPHTDAPWKVLSYLFYLPQNFELHEHGTSIYLPKDPDFRCVGGPHHPFHNFNRIYTAPFVPNSVLAFFKTDFSFHGVEPIKIQCQRDVLLWNLYDSIAHGR